MHHAVADEFRVVQRGDHGKHALLLREFQVGLEADDIIDGACGIIPAQLHDGIRLMPRLRVLEAHGLQRAVAQGIDAAPGHDLDGHTALEYVLVLKAVHRRLLRRVERVDKGKVFILIHCAVDIICIAPVVPGREPRLVHVDGREGHERRGGVKEAHILLPAEIALDRSAHRVGGQGTGRNDDRACRDLGFLRLHDGDVGVRLDFFRHHAGKAVAVDGQCAARLDAVCLRAGQDQAVQPPQLFFQKADGVFQPVAAQGVGADKLRKVRAVVRRRHFVRLHLGQRHMNAALGQLPRGLAARKTRADHFHFQHIGASFLSLYQNGRSSSGSVFLAAFFAAGFLAAGFFAAAFFAAGFFAAAFSVGFFAAAFFAAFFSSACFCAASAAASALDSAVAASPEAVDLRR